MRTSIYNRQNGKYSLMNDVLGIWCSKAKIGNTLLIATIEKSYKLKFCGEFKPKTTKFKISGKE